MIARISKSSCFAINSSGIPELYKFVTISFFSSPSCTVFPLPIHLDSPRIHLAAFRPPLDCQNLNSYKHEGSPWICLSHVAHVVRRHKTIRYSVTCVMTTFVQKAVIFKSIKDLGRNIDESAPIVSKREVLTTLSVTITRVQIPPSPLRLGITDLFCYNRIHTFQHLMRKVRWCNMD